MTNAQITAYEFLVAMDNRAVFSGGEPQAAADINRVIEIFQENGFKNWTIGAERKFNALPPEARQELSRIAAPYLAMSRDGLDYDVLTDEDARKIAEQRYRSAKQQGGAFPYWKEDDIEYLSDEQFFDLYGEPKPLEKYSVTKNRRASVYRIYYGTTDGGTAEIFFHTREHAAEYAETLKKDPYTEFAYVDKNARTIYFDE